MSEVALGEAGEVSEAAVWVLGGHPGEVAAEVLCRGARRLIQDLLVFRLLLNLGKNSLLLAGRCACVTLEHCLEVCSI